MDRERERPSNICLGFEPRHHYQIPFIRKAKVASSGSRRSFEYVDEVLGVNGPGVAKVYFSVHRKGVGAASSQGG